MLPVMEPLYTIAQSASTYVTAEIDIIWEGRARSMHMYGEGWLKREWGDNLM
jgi:hypothetical protein